MDAASTASDETVAFLLSKGADPDVLCYDGCSRTGYTALEVAIYSQCPSTIALLAPVTRKSLGTASASLALWQAELTPAVEDLIQRASLDQDDVQVGLA